MTVFNTVEHSDVQVRVCRDRRGSYIASGVRTIYVVPKGQPESSKVIAGRYSLKDVSIDGERCDLFFIRVADFDHSAGKYIAYTNLNFTAQYGRRVNVEFASNKYTITKSTDEDLDQRIKDLQDQLDILIRLRGQRQAIVPSSEIKEESQVATTSGPPDDTTPPPNPPSQEPTTPEQEQRGFVEGTVKNIDDLLNSVLGL